MKTIFQSLACLFSMTLVFAFFIWAIPDYPTVYFSVSTGKCTEIRLPDGTQVSCDRLNEFPKYEKVWVE